MKLALGMSIYCIRNLENGLCYVGQTRQTVAQRWSGHKSAAKKGQNGPLYDALRKSPDAFEVTALESDIGLGQELSDDDRLQCKLLFQNEALTDDDMNFLEDLSRKLDKKSKRRVQYLLKTSSQCIQKQVRKLFKPETELDKAEKKWIREMNSYFPAGYNVTPGGQLNKRKNKYYSRRCKMLGFTL